MTVTPLEAPSPSEPVPVDPATIAINEILTMVEDSENLYRRLLSARIPKAADPVTHFRELRRFWQRLGIEKPTRNAADHRARMLIAKIDGVKNSTEGAAQLLFDRALVAMEELLSAGVNDSERPVLTRQMFESHAGLFSLESGSLLGGKVSALPDGHFARSLVPEAELYSHGCPPCLVLSDCPKEKEVFFDTAHVLNLTRSWKSHQRRVEDASVAKEQERVAIKTREWEENASAQLKLLQHKVAQLEREKQEREAIAAASPG